MKNDLLAAIFSNNMVLQCDKPIRIFGNAGAGDEVSVSLGDAESSAIADKDGHWEVILPPMSADTDLTLKARSGNIKDTLKNVAIGEVWLAGGQSNMEFELGNCTDWERVKENPNPNIRFFYSPKLPFVDDRYEKAWDEAGWATVTSKYFNTWSAVAYLFAEQLAPKLGCTIGLIGCNWGGTSASCWVSRETLSSDKDLAVYIKDFDKKIKGITDKQQLKAYKDYEVYNDDWQARCNKLYQKNPTIEWSEVLETLGECKWPGPMNNYNPFRPCGLYEIMIKKICPYTIRGFLYYQGESDDTRPALYYKLMKALIDQWRDDWKDQGLVFLITQLPMHRYMDSKDFRNWPIIREAQLKAFQTVRNTGIAIIPDCGERNNIHPVDKSNVGKRLALQALFFAYDRISDTQAFGPIYEYKVPCGHSIKLYFKHAKRGMNIIGEPRHYYVAGADKVYHEAMPSVDGNCLTLAADEVEQPIYARYCWGNYNTPTLFGVNGLPASPFRTDPDPVADAKVGADVMKQSLEL